MMSEFTVLAFTPAGLCHPDLAIAACRAGGVGVVNAAYIQTSIVAGDVVVVANSGSSRLMVYRSTDNGNTFSFPCTLEHPAPGNGVSYLYARMETAATTTGPMLVLQQYIDNNTQRLLRFSVPLP